MMNHAKSRHVEDVVELRQLVVDEEEVVVEVGLVVVVVSGVGDKFSPLIICIIIFYALNFVRAEWNKFIVAFVSLILLFVAQFTLLTAIVGVFYFMFLCPKLLMTI